MRIVGVAAITFSLDAVERAWSESGERVALVDENGVVILSTTQSWKYRALKPLPEAVLERVDAARQYPPGPILPLAAVALDLRPEGAVVDGGRFPEGRGRWLAQSYPVRGAGWSLMLFSELRDIRQTALIGGSRLTAPLFAPAARPPALEELGGPFLPAEAEGERQPEHEAPEQDEEAVAHDVAADLHLVERHRPLRVVGVVLAVRRLAAVPVAAQVGHDHGVRRGQRRRDHPPRDVGLRRPVEQQDYP